MGLLPMVWLAWSVYLRQSIDRAADLVDEHNHNLVNEHGSRLAAPAALEQIEPPPVYASTIGTVTVSPLLSLGRRPCHERNR